MPMLLRATRSACVAVALVTIAATGCGQDLDLGPLTGKDGWTLPPSRQEPAQPRCVVNDPAALRPPERCFPVTDIMTTKTNDGPTFTWTFTTESCVVSGDGKVYSPYVPNDPYAACPIGVYWKFAPRPFHQPALAPLFPPDASFPDAAAFERSIAVYRQTDPENRTPEQWQQPFVSPGWETIPRNVRVLPDQEAVFVTLDPRTGKNEKFWVVLGFRDLYPGAQAPRHPSSEPLGLGSILNVAPGTGPVIEKRIEARQELGLQMRFRDTAPARP